MNRLAALIAGAFIGLGSGALAAPSANPGAESPIVEGWTITRAGSPTACVAAGPTDDGGLLSVVAEGPLFEMVVVASDFPEPKSTYPVILVFDEQPPVQAVALGENGQLAINVGRGGPARTITSASRVLVTADGHAHAFSLRNAAAALDAVARCAGQQTLAEQDDRPAEPIAGAGAWRLMVTMPGVAQRACAARVAGDQIDTIMLLNNDGDLILIGGHNDWATWGGDVALKLSIDGSAPVDMMANTVNNLMMTRITDPDQLRRLRTARTLDWTIPTGHVRGKVAGLGRALDAMRACRSRSEGE